MNHNEKSITIIKEIKEPLKISVVFAVYKEHNRILDSSKHPNGEDFLREKANQLENLHLLNNKFDWEIILVDDGCPNDSGKLAQEIAKESPEKIKVLFLQNFIKSDHPVVGTLSSTDQSRKGGSIILGMYEANRNKLNNHIIFFTDADLSTDLTQVGLLIDPILNKKKLAAIGSRREADSVVVKTGTRNNRGKLFIYLWKQMIPDLGYITDTQCGFKAFSSKIVDEITCANREFKFAFDVELLYKTNQIESESIQKVGITWIDSEAESTTTDLNPYLEMLQSMSKVSTSNISENQKHFCSLVNKLNEHDWQKLVDNIPKELIDGNPESFNETIVSVEVLENIL